MSAQRELLCLQRVTVRAVIAQSQSHLPLRMFEKTCNRLVFSHHRYANVLVLYSMPCLPPKLKDIFEVLAGGPWCTTEFYA